MTFLRQLAPGDIQENANHCFDRGIALVALASCSRAWRHFLEGCVGFPDALTSRIVLFVSPAYAWQPKLSIGPRPQIKSDAILHSKVCVSFRAMQLSIRYGLRILGLFGPRRNRTAALSTSEVASSSRAVMRGSSPCPGYEVSILRRGCFRFTK